jgi:hypothetical protein
MKYKVTETYTPREVPDDPILQETWFESDSTDFFELAVAARTACYPLDVRGADVISTIRRRLMHDDVLKQMIGQEITNFRYILRCASGDWEVAAEAELT